MMFYFARASRCCRRCRYDMPLRRLSLCFIFTLMMFAACHRHDSDAQRDDVYARCCHDAIRLLIIDAVITLTRFTPLDAHLLRLC